MQKNEHVELVAQKIVWITADFVNFFMLIVSTPNPEAPIVEEFTTTSITISWERVSPYISSVSIREKDTDVIVSAENYTDSTATHMFELLESATLYEVSVDLLSSGGSVYRTNQKDVRTRKCLNPMKMA